MARRRGSVTITFDSIEEVKAAHHAILVYKRLREGLHDHEANIAERRLAGKIYAITREEV